MHNEHILNYIDITSEYIKNYIRTNNEVSEFTCLVPKDKQPISSVLENNGFRYCGKRMVGGEVMIVFKWFRNLDKIPEDMRSFFNRRAQDYDLHMKDGNDSYDKAFTSLVEDIRLTNDKVRILDLGCGTGAELKYIFQRAPNAHVVCMDVSEEMLRILRADYPALNYDIEIICSSYLNADFGEGRFDYVIACSTLHHLLAEDRLKLYANVRKGLNKDGFLLISEYIAVDADEEQSLRNKYLELVESGAIERNSIYHIDLPLTLEHETELLKTAGFRCKRIERTGEKGFIVCAELGA